MWKTATFLAACVGAWMVTGTAMGHSASQACGTAGGAVETVRRADGATLVICRFPDGSACSEEALLRSVCTEGKAHLPTSDPVAYCRAMGTMDDPGPLWTGPRMPEVVATGLRHAMGVPADRPLEPFREGGFWRCMDGAVYACAIGANLPCTAKADASRTPNEGMVTYCRQNPGVAVIPAYAAGRETIYAWSCRGHTPEPGGQVVEVDQRGYLANIWHRVAP
ncbi:MAG TPA: DUF333 domain-containing protein [Azospirillum sp.]|nr:DUF333 domain-containing protein [Azospirillum sp.]